MHLSFYFITTFALYPPEVFLSMYIAYVCNPSGSEEEDGRPPPIKQESKKGEEKRTVSSLSLF
jgi:hypothetical protein